jgi:photosystem II stability/assembly factor-like uncharacterized protein
MDPAARGRDPLTHVLRKNVIYPQSRNLMTVRVRSPSPRCLSRSLASIVPLLPLFLGGGLIYPTHGQELDPGYFSALKARSIGPAGMSGRITAIDAVETDPNVLFVGTATGGVWKSVNGGMTWEPVFDDQRLLGIGAVAVFQPNPDVVWVGTGEGNPRNSAGVGAGVYKSLDGGRTWTLMGLERSERIHRILLHPSDPNIAYVGAMGPAWSDGEERGVFKTTDGGATWERVLFVNERTGIADLVLDPSNPDKLFAAMWEFRRWPWFFESGGPGSGLYLTRDGGESWTQITPADGLPEGELGRIGLSIARNATQVVYALVEADESALLRSDDGGRSWRTVNTDVGVADRPFYYADILVDPQNELRLFNLGSRIRLSEDGGESFQEIGDGVHSDFHALWMNPDDSRLMYLGSDGGIFVTRDGGDRWGMIDNLPVGQFYHVAVDLEIPFNVYGGMQDNGSWRGPSDLWENGGIRNYHWKEVGFGDGFGTLPDPSDPNVGYSMSQGGGLARYDLRTGERKGIRPWGPEGVKLRFNWNAAIAVDPFQAGTLYYGSQFVHKTSTRGESWEIISPDLTSNDPEKQRQGESGGITRDATGAENHTTILTIAPSPVERELIWVGTDDGRVHLTRSGGGHWEDVGRRIRGVPEGTWIPHVEASKHHGGTAYVVFDDHRRGNWTPYLFRTEDYGQKWRNLVDDDQIWGFVLTIEEDPVTPELLFAGTEFGLYVSLNRGEDWILWTHGLPRVPVRSLVVHPRDSDLVIGTHGRALYVLDDVRPLRALAQSPSLAELPVYLFDVPPAYLRNVAAVDGYHFAADAVFSGTTRPFGALLTYSVAPGSGADAAEIEILDDTGLVIRHMEGPANQGMNRVSWDLREDAFGPDSTGEGGRARPIPKPEVLPGRYTVRVAVGGSASESAVEVLPDPRVEIPLADRVRKREAVLLGLELIASGRAIEEKRQEVNGALERVLDLLGGREDEEAQGLRGAVEGIQVELGRVGEVLDEANRHRRTVLSMGETRDAPTETERIALSRMEDLVEDAIIRINGLLVTRVAELRPALAVARLEPMPEFRVVLREKRR